MVGNGISVCNIMSGSVSTNLSKNALLADGRAFGQTDNTISTGMKVERCAELIIKAMASNVEEVTSYYIIEILYHESSQNFCV